MPSALANASPLLLLTAAIPLTYVLAVALGRLLKHRQKVPLGFTYQLFCVVFAVWLPMHVYVRKFPETEPALANVLRQLDVLGALLGTYFVIALVRRYFWQLWFERRFHARAPKFLSDLGGLLLFAAAVVYALSREKGQPITGLAVGSTLVAAILGLALQDLLGNLIAGIALELGKPFRAGDWLLVDGRSLEVIELNWRSTRLRNTDDVYIDLPNKNVAGATITNFTLHNREHALRVQVGFDYSVPPNFVKDRIGHAVQRARGVLAAPPVKVYLMQFGDSAVIYDVKFWISEESQRSDILDAVNTNIWYEAQRSGIRIPFPMRTLQIERPQPRPETARETALACLRKQPFLQTLGEDQLNRLLKGARHLRFGRGEHVIEQGAEGKSMFILLAGSAEVFVRCQGSDTQVGIISVGEYCGEMSLLTGEPRSATVIATEDCEVWEIEKSALAGLLQENRELLRKLSESLAERRMENEGILAEAATAAQTSEKQKEYTEGFLRRLSAFFEF